MVDRSLDHPLAPKRRWFLKTVLATSAALGAVGGWTYWSRGVSNGTLTEQGRDIFKAIARAVLLNHLPTDKAQREAKLEQQMVRVNEIIQSMPTSSQQELAALLGALANAPTRWLLTGLDTAWSEASDQDITQALNTMRTHKLLPQLVTYHVLRDVTCLAYFSTPDNWSLAAYPGPLEL